MYVLIKIMLRFLILRFFDFFILTKILNQIMLCLYIWVTLYCPITIYSYHVLYFLATVILINILFTLENIKDAKNKVGDMLKK